MVTLSGSHSFSVVMHSYVLQATRALAIPRNFAATMLILLREITEKSRDTLNRKSGDFLLGET